MKSTIGRPRRLSDEQVARILAWHQQILALKSLRAALKTQRQLAAELDVAPATVARVIACRGEYKKPSP
jgi:transposase